MKITTLPSAIQITSSTEQSVGRTLEGIENAWNTHDMTAFASLLTDDCQWVNVVGMWWNGKPAVKKAHEVYHHIMFKDVRLKLEEASLREISPKVVVAVITSWLDAYTTPSGHKTPAGKSRMTAILVESGNRWLIASAQNTPIDEHAAPFDPMAPKTQG